MISHLWQYLFESTLQYLLSETTVGESIVKSPYDLLSHFYATFFVRDPLTTYIYIYTHTYIHIFIHTFVNTLYIYTYTYTSSDPPLGTGTTRGHILYTILLHISITILHMDR